MTDPFTHTMRLPPDPAQLAALLDLRRQLGRDWKARLRPVGSPRRMIPAMPRNSAPCAAATARPGSWITLCRIADPPRFHLW